MPCLWIKNGTTHLLFHLWHTAVSSIWSLYEMEEFSVSLWTIGGGYWGGSWKLKLACAVLCCPARKDTIVYIQGHFVAHRTKYNARHMLNTSITGFINMHIYYNSTESGLRGCLHMSIWISVGIPPKLRSTLLCHFQGLSFPMKLVPIF